ncbi:hypothetical protein B1810_11135 [Panacagrimonas perspica]|nr:hypothetical protein B1810_11135 [Panacagrimonas perspica]
MLDPPQFRQGAVLQSLEHRVGRRLERAVYGLGPWRIRIARTLDPQTSELIVDFLASFLQCAAARGDRLHVGLL